MTAVFSTGDEEWLPDHCPSWCDNSHAAIALESGDWAAAQIHRRSGGSNDLHEIRNSVDNRIMREGGWVWDLAASIEPFSSRGGYRTVETLNLSVQHGRSSGASIPLTPSEARSLARALVVLADQVELDYHA